MAKVSKKTWIVAGVLAAGVSVAAGWAYIQYKKMMNYVIGFKSIKVNKISKDEVSFDVFLNYTNKSDLKITLNEQEYSIYMNGSYLTTLKNYSPNTIQPNSTSVLGVNVTFDPKQAAKVLKMNWADLLQQRDKVKIRLDMKFRVKLLFFSVPISYSYEDTLKYFMGS